MSPVSADYVAAWLLELHDGHEVEFAHAGHLAIHVPTKLRQEIGAVAAAEKKSKTDWIVGRLEERGLAAWGRLSQSRPSGARCPLVVSREFQRHAPIYRAPID
jgi:hypothetical protein